MKSNRLVVIVSTAPARIIADWTAEFQRNGCNVEVVSGIADWWHYHRPANTVAFLLDSMSADIADHVEQLAIGLHHHRPIPDVGLIIPDHDPREFISRFEDSHIWVHRHGTDDWMKCIQHIAGVRNGEHAHAA